VKAPSNYRRSPRASRRARPEAPDRLFADPAPLPLEAAPSHPGARKRRAPTPSQPTFEPLAAAPSQPAARKRRPPTPSQPTFEPLEPEPPPVDDKARRVLEAISRTQLKIEFSIDGMVLDANPNFLRAMGYSLEEVKGQHHRLFCDPSFVSSPAYQTLWAGLRAGELQSSLYSRRKKNGEEVWLQATYVPVLDAAGVTTSVVKIATDVTQQRKRAAEIDKRVQAISGKIGGSANELSQVATQLAAGATETSAQAMMVNGAAEEIKSSVASVASAAEEMSATVKEIAANATESAKTAREARDLAEHGQRHRAEPVGGVAPTSGRSPRSSAPSRSRPTC
jgi:PAS domain S-box-containing protein